MPHKLFFLYIFLNLIISVPLAVFAKRTYGVTFSLSVTLCATLSPFIYAVLLVISIYFEKIPGIIINVIGFISVAFGGLAFFLAYVSPMLVDLPTYYYQNVFIGVGLFVAGYKGFSRIKS